MLGRCQSPQVTTYTDAHPVFPTEVRDKLCKSKPWRDSSQDGGQYMLI